MRRFVQHWEGGLRATGGALRVDKSYWYLIDFKWVNNRWMDVSKTDLPGDILVQDADGKTKILPQLNPHEANETLGIFIAMDGNQKAEVIKLRAKAEPFADQVRTGFVSKAEAWQVLRSTIMKTHWNTRWKPYPSPNLNGTTSWHLSSKPSFLALALFARSQETSSTLPVHSPV